MEKLVYLVIRETEEEKHITKKTLDILDERFLEVPGYALEQGKAAALAMFEETRRSLDMSSTLLEEYSPEMVGKIKDSEDLVDGYENQIGNYLLALTRKSLSAKESQALSVLLHTVSDIETISDQTCNIAIAYKGMEAKEEWFSEKAVQELKVQQAAVTALVDATIGMFENRAYIEVYAYDQVIERLLKEIKERHVARLINNECSISLGMRLTDILNSYERIAGRCMRIANYLSQLGEKELEIHDHENLLALSDYQELYGEYKKKYCLN